MKRYQPNYYMQIIACAFLLLSVSAVKAQCIPPYVGATNQLYLDTVEYNSLTSITPGVNNDPAGTGNNNSGTNDGYQDFRAFTTDVIRGEDLTFTLTTNGNPTRIPRSEYAIFIDWNDDLDFSPFDVVVTSDFLEIDDDSMTTSGSNNTNFGSVDISSGAVELLKCLTILAQ